MGECKAKGEEMGGTDGIRDKWGRKVKTPDITNKAMLVLRERAGSQHEQVLY